MAVQTQRMTVEEFEQFVAQPENADRLFEYIGGEIIAVVSNNYASAVAARVLIQIGLFVTSKNLGYITGADGGYVVAGERYIPDVAFVARDRQAEPSHDAYNPVAPTLAVEVLSPTNDPGNMRLKVSNYLAAGTVVWVVDPDTQRIEIHAPGQPARRIGAEATLEGGAVLPGFAIAVQELFPE